MPPLAMRRPSGLTATDVTAASWPVSVAIDAPVRAAVTGRRRSAGAGGGNQAAPVRAERDRPYRSILTRKRRDSAQRSRVIGDRGNTGRRLASPCEIDEAGRNPPPVTGRRERGDARRRLGSPGDLSGH